MLRCFAVTACCLALFPLAAQSAPPATDAPPLEWTDPDTGYRIHRLTTREGENRSFYFHNNPFVPGVEGGEGERADDLMLFHGAMPKDGAADDGDKRRPPRQLFVMNLRTQAIRQLTDEPRGVSGEIVSAKARRAYYQVGPEVYSIDVDSGAKRLITTLPEEMVGKVSTVNADDTLLAGAHAEGIRELYRKYPKKSQYFGAIYRAKLPNKLFTIDVKSGEVKVIHEENAWLNHLQFSPTDPQRLSYCHEGHWHLVQRMWNLNLATGETQPIHKRTVHREIAGHEFWSRDGKVLWFDLQIPRGETFFLTGYDFATGQETRYQHERHEWSVHYNISPDQKLFVGDGGSEGSVAGSPDGQWIYLFEPEGDRLRSTRLANLESHDYGLEPNAHFTPDGRRIIFRSNMHGPTHIYAIDLER